MHIEFDHEVRISTGLPAADLIVACDGANSRTRLEAGKFQTDVRVGRNKSLWLGTDKAFESFTSAFVHTESGWIWAYCYGIGSDLSTFLVECSPRTWAGLGFDHLSAKDGISVLERLFEPQLDGHSLLVQAGQGASTGWLNFRTITNRRWHDGNIVLAGDAAHTTHYTIGAGTTLAVEFAALMRGRGSRLLPYLPPHLFYQLHHAVPGPRAKAVSLQHGPTRPGDNPGDREHVMR